MTYFVFRNDPDNLPEYAEDIIPVQLYRINKHIHDNSKSACVALTLRERIRDLGVEVSVESFDFLSIAVSVTAAETFARREDSFDSWSRILDLDIQLFRPSDWEPVKKEICQTLNYLTGDTWSLNFTSGGLGPPSPKKSPNAQITKRKLEGLNSVCLFSGGLDSAVGAIDLINGKSIYKPLLVSHAYKGDKSKQDSVESLLDGDFSRLALSVEPKQIKELEGQTDISMRGRSFNFIAMAVVGLSAIRRANDYACTDIIIPENGYISINPPLTRRRTGSLSTRTTHPYYLNMLEKILNKVGFDLKLSNPYQSKTKGEMLQECKDKIALAKALPNTVSCSKWHRKNIQCGVCLPCIIRRASVKKAGYKIDASYDNAPSSVIRKHTARDDIQALGTAIMQNKSKKRIIDWVRKSGPLPQDAQVRNDIEDVVRRGLKEVEEYLNGENCL